MFEKFTISSESYVRPNSMGIPDPLQSQRIWARCHRKMGQGSLSFLLDCQPNVFRVDTFQFLDTVTLLHTDMSSTISCMSLQLSCGVPYVQFHQCFFDKKQKKIIPFGEDTHQSKIPCNDTPKCVLPHNLNKECTR